VALADFAAPYGAADVLAGFDRAPERTLESLAVASDDLTRADLARAAPVARAGYRVLAGAQSLEQAATINASDALRLIASLRRAFAVTVLDTTSYADDLFVGASQGADLVLLVTSAHVIAARSLLRLVGSLERVGVLRERIAIVINGLPRKSSSQQQAVSKQVETAFSGAIAATIPLVDRPWVEWRERGDEAPRPLHGDSGAAFPRLAERVAQRIGLQVPNAGVRS
jgi:Flp pilus assembly CpaE family ATPase